MATVLITGGSGMVGQRLTHALLALGHQVRWLSRKPQAPSGVQGYTWDLAKGTVQRGALYGADHVVHLAGAGIADKRWTPERMKVLQESRGGAARVLLAEANRRGAQPLSFISASGTGYYGARTSSVVHEEHEPAGTDAIAHLTKDWEDATLEWSGICRAVALRTPIVLSQKGGALEKLAAPVRYGFGAALGSGRQCMPWVHVDDLVNAYVHAIFNESVQGAYNIAAPDQPTNADFMRSVARVLGRPIFLPNVPAWLLRMALGGVSSVLLAGNRVSWARSAQSGFVFRYAGLEAALVQLLRGS
jgi:uncharacterized protein